MGNRIADVGVMRSRVEADGWMNNFAPRKIAKLGTDKNPVIVRVQSQARLAEVSALAEKHGWHCRIGIDADKAEDIADLERLLHPQKPTIAEKKIGRNQSCSCGSGKKFKHCCGK